MAKKKTRLTMAKPIELKSLLAYKNPEVVARFCKEMGLTKKIGNQVFKDLMRFLYLNSKLRFLHEEMNAGRLPQRALPPVMFILDSMLIIDEMWHTFVLYTTQYEAFSMKYFGHYLHHDPTPTLPSLRKKAVTFNPDHLDIFLEFVWDEVGAATVERWFEDYRKKFHKKSIAKLKLIAVEAA